MVLSSKFNDFFLFFFRCNSYLQSIIIKKNNDIQNQKKINNIKEHTKHVFKSILL